MKFQVDDTHALAVFSSAKIAAEVLSLNHSFIRLKPLSEATMESRTKAKKCSNSLQPYRQRPETCAGLLIGISVISFNINI